MMTLVQHLRPLAPKSLATTSDWAGVEQVSSEFSRVSILHGCPPTVTWHKNVCSRRFSDFQTHRCGAMIAIKAVPFYLDVGASFYSSLTINWRFMVSNFDDFPVKTMNPHRIGIHGGDLRKSVINEHVSIWVDRCGFGFPFENRFSCTQNYLHVPKLP